VFNKTTDFFAAAFFLLVTFGNVNAVGFCRLSGLVVSLNIFYHVSSFRLIYLLRLLVFFSFLRPTNIASDFKEVKPVEIDASEWAGGAVTPVDAYVLRRGWGGGGNFHVRMVFVLHVSLMGRNKKS
jgi:hypothetical protein